MEQPQPSSISGSIEKHDMKSKLCMEDKGLLVSDDDHSCSQESLSSLHPMLDGGIEPSSPSQTDECDSSECPSNMKKYDNCPWEDLPGKGQEADNLLGYTKEIGNCEDENQPDSSKEYWEETNAEEKEATKGLGDDEDHCDFGCKMEVTPEDYDDLYWNQLPRRIRKAYRVLGYRKSLWDDDGFPASFDKDWFELSDAEKRAATIVGYTAEMWDEDPQDEKPKTIAEETIVFVKGSSYIMLECIALSAFLAVIKSFFSIGERYLDDHILGALKILLGLAIMEFSGQMHMWLGYEEEVKDDYRQIPLFRSFLNLFSWWSIFAGVDHFMEAFESDVLYLYSDTTWYLKMCEEEVNTTQLVNATQVGNTTFAIAKDRILNYTSVARRFVIDNITCELLDDDHERMGSVYHWTVFLSSAYALWYAFGDNFLTGCDSD